MHPVESPFADAAARRAGASAAALTFAGVVLSGPAALLLVAATKPQPAWQGAEAFVRNYHPVQAVPFFLGFFLVGGFVALVASLHVLARPEQKPRTLAALGFAATFAALVFFNYVLQTTFVPSLVYHDEASARALIAALTMSNPTSLGWALEMWGYALLGVATWLAAPVFEGSRLASATSWTFVVNGPASIVPAFLTAFAPGWEMTAPGMFSFAVWNLLVMAMTLLAFIVLRRRAGGR